MGPYVTTTGDIVSMLNLIVAIAIVFDKMRILRESLLVLVVVC
jgi:hypothetical protein